MKNPQVAEGFAKTVHATLRENIEKADKKAAFMFTAGVSLIALLNRTQATELWPVSNGALDWRGAVALIALISLMIGVVFAIAVVVPDLRHRTKTGYVFWESILAFKSPVGYINAIKQEDAGALAEQLLEDCYELSRICKTKYQQLNFAIAAGTIGTFCTVFLLVTNSQNTCL